MPETACRNGMWTAATAAAASVLNSRDRDNFTFGWAGTENLESNYQETVWWLSRSGDTVVMMKMMMMMMMIAAIIRRLVIDAALGRTGGRKDCEKIRGVASPRRQSWAATDGHIHLNKNWTPLQLNKFNFEALSILLFSFLHIHFVLYKFTNVKCATIVCYK